VEDGTKGRAGRPHISTALFSNRGEMWHRGDAREGDSQGWVAGFSQLPGPCREEDVLEESIWHRRCLPPMFQRGMESGASACC
jgi:hypothetical protein